MKQKICLTKSNDLLNVIFRGTPCIKSNLSKIYFIWKSCIFQIKLFFNKIRKSLFLNHLMQLNTRQFAFLTLLCKIVATS